MKKEGEKESIIKWLKKRGENALDHLLGILLGILVLWFIGNSRMVLEGGVAIFTAKIDIFWVGLIIILLAILFERLYHRAKNRMEKEFKKGMGEVEGYQDLEENYENRIKVLQKGIKEHIIPQLQNKVIDSHELSEYKDIDNFLKIWNEGRMQKFSTWFRLTKIDDFQLIFTNKGKILNDFKNADKELSDKLDNLLKDLKKYDRKMGDIIHKIFIYYEKNISHENWQNLGELEYYAIFDIKDELQRIGHNANPNNTSTSIIIKYELIEEILLLANELIEKCNEIVNWNGSVVKEVDIK